MKKRESQRRLSDVRYAKEGDEWHYEGGDNKPEGKREQIGMYLWQSFTKVSVTHTVTHTVNDTKEIP